ncbi:DUF11 domain-containing protein [Paenibacillus paridis]|uniref:DUF11 domain-containing protein n=1 Tax=Paenibacillus paridis TaxID=2583376 RepID=UPI0011213CBB|nr:DUF11 domain-containing protein [Paenibacillus paridis]
MSPQPLNQPMLQNQSLVQFASGSVEMVTYSNTVNTALIGTRILIDKTAYESEVFLGSTITYSLVATNTGNIAGTVTLTDKLPEGTSFVANSVLLGGVPVPGANPDAGIALGSLAPQETARVVFQLIVVSLPGSLQLVNQAQADAVFQTAEGRSITSTSYSNKLVTPVNAVSIAAVLSASTNQTFPSDYVTYQLTVVNEGNLALRDATAFVTLPAGALFVAGSVTVNAVISPVADPRTGIPLGLLRPQSTVVITYRTQTTEDSPELSVSQAIIRYLVLGTPSFVESNAVTVTLIKPEITVTKQVDRTSALPGDWLRYAITISNGQNIAVDAVLEDIIPAGTAFAAGSLKLNGAPLPGENIEDGIMLGTLLGQSQNVITFDAMISSPFTGSSPLTNTARANYTFRLSDGRVVSNTAYSNAAATTVASPIITIAANVNPAIVEYGDSITIHSMVSNKGNLAADVAFISDFPLGVDLLPKSFRVDGRRLPPTAFDGIGSWKLGSLLPGDSLQIVYSAIVTDAVVGDEILGYARAKFSYQSGNQTFTGEVESNVLPVTVTEDDE